MPNNPNTPTDADRKRQNTDIERDTSNPRDPNRSPDNDGARRQQQAEQDRNPQPGGPQQGGSQQGDVREQQDLKRPGQQR